MKPKKGWSVAMAKSKWCSIFGSAHSEDHILRSARFCWWVTGKCQNAFATGMNYDFGEWTQKTMTLEYDREFHSLRLLLDHPI